MSVPDIDLHRVTADDVDDLVAYELRNREFHRPTAPIREGGDATPDQLRERIRASISSPGRVAYCIRVTSGELVGTIALSNITRAAWLNATMGYSMDEAWTRRGIATEAARRTVRAAFTEHGLHRVEAGTLLDNIGSQKVLLGAGFERIGVSRYHLQIAGAWSDHVLFSCTPEILAERD
jgi:ribosomal-protein-alanine N-acetyltransferase